MDQNASNNQSNITVREARAEDDDFFGNLYFAVRKDKFADLGWDDNQIKMLLKMQFDAQAQGYRMQYPDMKSFVIETDETAVGRMILTDEIRLVDIAVLPESRNLGIGSAALNYLFEKAARENKNVVLQVLKTNVAAFRLYERLGFRPTGEDDLYLMMRRETFHAQN